MDRIEEYATLKAIGAGNAYLRRVVGTQALASGAVGWLLGVAIAVPATWGAARLIPWIARPGWLSAAVLAPTIAMSLLASVASIRRVTRVEPARVFRA
jgi:putative ABC transport system permease protein